MTFADKLQSLRKAKRLSQEDLAEKCEVTRQSVFKWETSLGYPETENAGTLRPFGRDLDYLLRDKSDISNTDKVEKLASPYAPYIGKWLQIFLKDKFLLRCSYGNPKQYTFVSGRQM